MPEAVKIRRFCRIFDAIFSVEGVGCLKGVSVTQKWVEHFLGTCTWWFEILRNWKKAQLVNANDLWPIVSHSPEVSWSHRVLQVAVETKKLRCSFRHQLHNLGAFDDEPHQTSMYHDVPWKDLRIISTVTFIQAGLRDQDGKRRNAPRWEFEGLSKYFWFILRWVIYGWPFGPLGFFAWTIDHGWSGLWDMAGKSGFGVGALRPSDILQKIKLFFERHLQEILSTKWNVLQWFIVNQYCINYPEIIIIATFTSLVCRIYMSCILSERKTYEKIIYWHDFSFASLTSIAEVSSETFSQQCEVFSGCLLWLSIFSFEVIDVCFLKNMFLEWIERVYSFFWPVLQHEYKPICYIRLKQ